MTPFDSRGKILTAKSAPGAIGKRDRVRAITGTFDPVYAEHARLLRKLHDGSCTVIVMTDPPSPLSSQRARAEVVAALSSVDFVVLTNGDEVEAVLKALGAAEVLREEAADQERSRRLIQHVYARQKGE